MRTTDKVIGSLGATIVVFWVVVAMFPLVVAPAGPLDQYLTFKPPQSQSADGIIHWLGTDQIGRDIWGSIAWQSRIELIVPLVILFACYCLAIPLALAAISKHARLSATAKYIVRIMRTLPLIVIFAIFFLTFRNLAIGLIVAFFIASAPGVLNIVQTLHNRGSSSVRNMLARLLLVDAARRYSFALGTNLTLGFLGFYRWIGYSGWGAMVADARSMVDAHPYLFWSPVIAICSLLLGVSLLAVFVNRLRDPIEDWTLITIISNDHLEKDGSY